jgi:hypothetical protein
MRFRKRPVEVEAMQWDGSRASAEAICRWVNDRPEYADEPIMSYLSVFDDGHVSDVQIFTLEGPHNVSPKDWVIRGIGGEFYPCKPDIFEATYEPV